MSDKYQFHSDRSQNCNTRQEINGLIEWIRGFQNTASEDLLGVNSAPVVRNRNEWSGLSSFHQLDKNGSDIYSTSKPYTSSIH